jgi:hypothetical protein
MQVLLGELEYFFGGLSRSELLEDTKSYGEANLTISSNFFLF